MKNLIKPLGLFLFFSLIITSFVSCKNKEAEKYFNEALEILNANFYSISDEDFNNTINLLNKSINADKTMWKAYRQKNQLYKERENYDKIVEVYNQWIENENSMDLFNQFSYGCALYTAGNKDKAISIFNEIYNNNKDKLNHKKFYKKEEAQFVATVFCGIITKNIKDIYPIDDYIVPGNPQETMDAYNALSQEDKLQGLFYDFLIHYNENPYEVIKSYAGV